jgi:hypothetical protein
VITKEHAFKAEIVVALLIMAVISISLFKPSPTGFVPANVERNPLDIVIEKSQVYKMRFNETTTLHSFAISGEVAGSGTAYVFLDNREGQRLLVYSNVRAPQDLGGAKFITGLATAEIQPGQVIDSSIQLEENEELVMGPFINECIQTCTTPPDFSRDEYDLVFLVQPETRLTIDEIIYITE